MLYLEDSHIIQESWHIWQWPPLYDCQSPLNRPQGDMAIHDSEERFECTIEIGHTHLQPQLVYTNKWASL